MAHSAKERRAQAAWDRIEALGGDGVWDAEVVMVSFANTGITDDDLAVFRDFPFVQTLDLSGTAVTEAGLTHLDELSALEVLDVRNTKITRTAIAAFRKRFQAVTVITKKPSTSTINPFTGKPNIASQS